MDSPSRTSNRHQSDVFHRSHDEDDDDEDERDMEKYSAFKTPMSSRHNSLEYLALESPMKIIQQMKGECHTWEKAFSMCPGHNIDNLSKVRLRLKRRSFETSAVKLF